MIGGLKTKIGSLALCGAAGLCVVSACGGSRSKDPSVQIDPAAQHGSKPSTGNSNGEGNGGGSTPSGPKKEIPIEGRKTSENRYDYTVNRKQDGSQKVPVTLEVKTADIKLTEVLVPREVSGGVNFMKDYVSLSEKPYENKIEYVNVSGTSAESKGISYRYESKDNVVVFGDFTFGFTAYIGYKVGDGPKLEYSFSNAKEAQGIKIYDKNTKAAIVATFNGKNVAIPQSEFVSGRVLTVEYTDVLKAVTATLDFEPIAGSIITGVLGCDESRGVKVNGKQITIDCKLTQQTVLDLKYKFLLQPPFKFIYQENVDPELAEWEVLVNGAAYSKYRREGLTFYIDEVLDEGTVVSIIYKKN